MKTAIIGAHPFEHRALYENLCKKFQATEVVACTDPSMEKEAALFMANEFGINALELEEILNDPDIKVILNATFPAFSEDITEKCLRGKKNVFTTRQIANSFERAKELYELAEKNQVILSCGPDAVYAAGIQTSRYMIDHNAIGKVHSAAISLARDNHFIAEAMLPHIMQPYGGILYDMSGFFLIPLIFLLGSVKKVSAFGSKGTEESSIKTEEYEVLTVILEFENQEIVTMHLNSNSIFQKDMFKIAGENGVLDLGYPHEYDAPLSMTTFGMKTVNVPFRAGFSEMSFGIGVVDVAYAVQNSTSPIVNNKVALHDAEILHGIITSIQTGEVYEMNSSVERPQPLREYTYFEGMGEKTFAI